MIIYYPLLGAVLLLSYGAMCYYLQKHEIQSNNKMFKHRPSSNHILIKLKLFKYDWKFNYWLLIPYLLAWNIFLGTICLYLFYWCGIKALETILLQKWFLLIIGVLCLIMMIYAPVIQAVIFRYNSITKKIGKDEKIILKKVIFPKGKNKDKPKK